METQVILSLDVSTTCTGYALYLGNKLEDYGVITHKSNDWVERVRFMAVTVNNLNKAYGITHIVIEDTYVSKNVNTVKKLCMAQGILLGSVPTAKLIQVYPASWKSHFGMTKKKTSRGEQKDSSVTIAEAMVLASITSDDEADAILMGRYVVDNAKELL